MVSTRALEPLRWPLVVAYLVLVSSLAAALIAVGSLLGRIPGLPAGVEQRYAASLMRLLSAVFRPFDALSSVDPDGRF